MGVEGTSSELLYNINICLNSDIYISGRDGRNYLDLGLFKDVKVVYHDFEHPLYKQKQCSEFFPYMSTLDLLFNYSNDDAFSVVSKRLSYVE